MRTLRMAGSKKIAYPACWDGMLAAATAAGAKFPKLVAAQAALESGWFEHTSGRNNYFGGLAADLQHTL